MSRITFRRRIRAWGHSKGLVLPSAIMETLTLNVGDEVSIHIENSHIIIKKVTGDN